MPIPVNIPRAAGRRDPRLRACQCRGEPARSRSPAVPPCSDVCECVCGFLKANIKDLSGFITRNSDGYSLAKTLLFWFPLSSLPISPWGVVGEGD